MQRRVNSLTYRVGHEIVDEFTDLPIPYCQKMELRYRRDGKCLRCGEPRVTTRFCLKHAEKNRDLARKRTGAKRRNKNSLTYRVAAARTLTKLSQSRSEP